MTTHAERLAALPAEQRAEILGAFTADQLLGIQYAWPFWARPDQSPPPGDWRTWLNLGGRGSGKTRTAAEWIRREVDAGRRRQIGIVGPTVEALRRVQIEGPSGILAIYPPNERPVYEMTVGRLVWPNGAVAHLFSAEEPDRLRGPNLDAAWVDELCSMANAPTMWDMLMMAVRIPGPTGLPAQIVVTTTPRPSPLLRTMMTDPSTVLTRSRTMDNAANLDAATLKHLQRRYGGTTLGRQELDAEVLDDIDGALWNRGMLDRCRVPFAPESQPSVVVAIDPSGGSGSNNAETGIIVACRGQDGHAYVLADASGRLSPERWATRAVDLYQSYRADRIVAEQNFGGAMVENTIRMVAPARVKMVQASRGKAIRAEPVVAIYEQCRVHHVGVFAELEDQLCQWTPDGGGPSPDRLDALVWAITELMVDGPNISVWGKL